MLFQQFIDNRKLREYFPLSIQYQKWWRSGVDCPWTVLYCTVEKDAGDKDDISGGRVIFPISLYRKLVIVEIFLSTVHQKKEFFLVKWIRKMGVFSIQYTRKKIAFQSPVHQDGKIISLFKSQKGERTPVQFTRKEGVFPCTVHQEIKNLLVQ
jgi:hypothetical protein